MKVSRKLSKSQIETRLEVVMMAIESETNVMRRLSLIQERINLENRLRSIALDEKINGVT